MDLPQDASWLQSHAMACVSQSFSSTADILRACCLHLQVIIGLLTRQRHSGGSVHLLAVLLEEGLVDLGGGRSKGGGGNKFQRGVADELAGEPEEGLLEVVVGLGGDVVVLEVLLAVEGDGLGLDLALLHIDLVTAEDNGDVLADTDEITVPVGDVLVGGEAKRVNFDTQRGQVLLLEFTSQVTLDKGGLASATIANKHKLEGGNLLLSHGCRFGCYRRRRGWFGCGCKQAGCLIRRLCSL